jgi:hypothetical protein
LVVAAAPTKVPSLEKVVTLLRGTNPLKKELEVRMCKGFPSIEMDESVRRM